MPELTSPIDAAPAALGSNKDLPALPMALGATGHLSGNVVPIAIPWSVTGSATGVFVSKVLETAPAFLRATKTRPSATICGPIEVSMALQPSETATAIWATVVLAAVPNSHGKLATVEALAAVPGRLFLTATMMGGATSGVLELLPNLQRNLLVEGTLGEGFRLQAIVMSVGVTQVHLSIQFPVEVQGWVYPAPDVVVPF